MKRHLPKLILVLVGLSFVIWYNDRKVIKQTPLSDLLNEGRAIKLLCDVWAIDHNGKFPPKLSDLFRDENNLGISEQDAHKWSYTPNLSNTDNGQIVILSLDNFPRIENKRILIRVNGSVSAQRLNTHNKAQ